MLHIAPDLQAQNKIIMTGYSGIFLFIVSFYATYNFFRIFAKSRKIFHFCLGSSTVFLAIIGVSEILAQFFPVLDPEFINDWSSIISVSFVLSAAAALIRDSKPAFTRFPRFFTLVPMLLILFYPLVLETVVLKVWMLFLYQGSAVIIGLLMYGYKTYHDSKFGYMLIGVLFFLLTFILYWLPSSLFTLPEYVWVLLVSSGVLVITVGYNQIHDDGSTMPKESHSEDQWFV